MGFRPTGAGIAAVRRWGRGCGHALFGCPAHEMFEGGRFHPLIIFGMISVLVTQRSEQSLVRISVAVRSPQFPAPAKVSAGVPRGDHRCVGLATGLNLTLKGPFMPGGLPSKELAAP